MDKKFAGLSFVSFLAAAAGVIVSFLLLKEDVISTAHTVFEYFPMKFGVTPSTSWSGAIILGVFTSILQVVSASVAFSNKFPKASRFLAFFSFVCACLFDNWTDVVFRSGNLTGDLRIATITTIAFYTLGSEVTQGLSWLVFLSMWRIAVSEFMWGLARLGAGLSSIGVEWRHFSRAARNKENKDRGLVDQEFYGGGGQHPRQLPQRPSQYRGINRQPSNEAPAWMKNIQSNHKENK